MDAWCTPKVLCRHCAWHPHPTAVRATLQRLDRVIHTVGHAFALCSSLYAAMMACRRCLQARPHKKWSRVAASIMDEERIRVRARRQDQRLKYCLVCAFLSPANKVSHSGDSRLGALFIGGRWGRGRRAPNAASVQPLRRFMCIGAGKSLSIYLRAPCFCVCGELGGCPGRGARVHRGGPRVPSCIEAVPGGECLEVLPDSV